MLFAVENKKLASIILSLYFLKVGPSFAETNYRPWAQKGKVSTEQPPELKDVGISEKNGDSLDPNLTFTDDQGRQVKLGDFFHKNKPLILSLVYFDCPSLCNLHLNGVTDALKLLGKDWGVGEKFEILAVSFNSKENWELAQAKKKNYLKAYGREDSGAGWHFLTGTEDQVSQLTQSVGFGYKWIEDMKEFAHASAAIIITPDGKISRYIHGISFDPATLRLSLVEASKGKIGDIVDRFMLFCFRYDPNKKTYAFYAYNIMKVGAGVAALMLFAFLIPHWKKMYKEDNTHNS